jgi:hypothetical protein
MRKSAEGLYFAAEGHAGTLNEAALTHGLLALNTMRFMADLPLNPTFFLARRMSWSATDWLNYGEGIVGGAGYFVADTYQLGQATLSFLGKAFADPEQAFADTKETISLIVENHALIIDRVVTTFQTELAGYHKLSEAEVGRLHGRIASEVAASIFGAGALKNSLKATKLGSQLAGVGKKMAPKVAGALGAGQAGSQSYARPGSESR